MADLPPKEPRNFLRTRISTQIQGLVEASANKIGTVADRILLFCCQYDPTTGKYGMVIARVTRVFGTATALMLFGFVFIMLRRDRRGHSHAGRTA